MTQLAVRPRTESCLIPTAVIASVLTAAAAAWLVLTERMAGMDSGPGGDPGALAWSSAGRYVAGASVAAAGLYQLIDAKRRWLARCTAPELHPPRCRIAGSLLAGTRAG